MTSKQRKEVVLAWLRTRGHTAEFSEEQLELIDRNLNRNKWIGLIVTLALVAVAIWLLHRIL